MLLSNFDFDSHALNKASLFVRKKDPNPAPITCDAPFQIMTSTKTQAPGG